MSRSRKYGTIPLPVPFFDISAGSSIELLTVREAAEFLKVSVSSLRRLQQGRMIPFIKVGGSVRFAKNDLLVYLQRQRVEAIGS